MEARRECSAKRNAGQGAERQGRPGGRRGSQGRRAARARFWPDLLAHHFLLPTLWGHHSQVSRTQALLWASPEHSQSLAHSWPLCSLPSGVTQTCDACTSRQVRAGLELEVPPCVPSGHSHRLWGGPGGSGAQAPRQRQCASCPCRRSPGAPTTLVPVRSHQPGDTERPAWLGGGPLGWKNVPICRSLGPPLTAHG